MKTLADYQITHKQSCRWQDMAALPDDKFEDALATAKENGWELSSRSIQLQGISHRLSVTYQQVTLTGPLVTTLRDWLATLPKERWEGHARVTIFLEKPSPESEREG